MKRQKIDYQLVIALCDVNNEFDAYRCKHNSISFNRCARSFCVSKGFNYKKACFVVPVGMTSQEHFNNVVHAKWIED